MCARERGGKRERVKYVFLWVNVCVWREVSEREKSERDQEGE